VRACLGCTAVLIEAIATYPVGLGLPPRLLAQPPRAVATPQETRAVLAAWAAAGA